MSNASNQIVLLDGGMGQELIRRSGEKPSPLWSAKVMHEKPELVRDLHIDFIQAGARVITLNAYAATPERLQKTGGILSFEALQQSAVRAAQQARDQAAVEGVMIAGCLPPLVGSYRPELAPDYETALATYRKVVEQQAQHVDCFLCETMASIKEASASALAARESGKPVWVGLTVEDDLSGKLRSGEPLADALTALDEIGVEAKLLNCSQPESIDACWSELSACGGPYGAYANAFTSIVDLAPGGTVEDLHARADLDPVSYAQVAMRWVEEGASIVGGCCEVGPGHISQLARQLGERGLTITGQLNMPR